MSDWASFHRLYVAAYEAGAERTSIVGQLWNLAGRCSNPYRVELGGRPEGLLGQRDADVYPEYLMIDTRCRRCPACLRFRSWVWRSRAEIETRLAPRSWFGTLTLSPEAQYKHGLRAAQAAARNGDDFEELEPEAQFRLRHNSISKEVTKYLKRIRERSGAVLRYFLVAEAHKSGLPHYHLMLHEVFIDRPVRKALLERQWREGYASYKLADTATASYVAKYLSKSNMARVRASIRYGKTLSG